MQNRLFSSISHYVKSVKISFIFLLFGEQRIFHRVEKNSTNSNLIIETCRQRIRWSRRNGRRNSRYAASGSAVIVFDFSGHDRSLLLFIPIHVYFPGHEFTARAVIEPAGPESFHCPRKTFRFAISPCLTAELSFETV